MYLYQKVVFPKGNTVTDFHLSRNHVNNSYFGLTVQVKETLITLDLSTCRF